VLSARAAIREIDRARFSVRLQSDSVAANLLRQRELKLKSDEVTAQDRLDAENELLATLNGLDNAERDLNNAILNYLLVTGQLRVTRAGQFEPPPGLLAEPDEDGDAADSSSQSQNPDGDEVEGESKNDGPADPEGP